MTFLFRDAALVNDDEMEDIRTIVDAELDSVRHRNDDREEREVLRMIEFIDNDPHPARARYHTVSDVTGTPE
ncbi:hypothetical protein SEA_SCOOBYDOOBYDOO_216 [Mycobacterium phage ScoobyDoobyDoo]|nr:hypothetical protein SEA_SCOOBYDOOBYDOO_216 [Mycobacterium phage ScoobyDoobyDoo]